MKCGRDFTIFCCDSTLYSCGNNCHGQLGRITTNTFDSTIAPLENFGSAKMYLFPLRLLWCKITARTSVQLSCGEDHSMCLLEDGSLWGWGCGTEGRYSISILIFT